MGDPTRWRPVCGGGDEGIRFERKKQEGNGRWKNKKN
jgi:hypothetical protein